MNTALVLTTFYDDHFLQHKRSSDRILPLLSGVMDINESLIVPEVLNAVKVRLFLTYRFQRAYESLQKHPTIL